MMLLQAMWRRVARTAVARVVVVVVVVAVVVVVVEVEAAPVRRRVVAVTWHSRACTAAPSRTCLTVRHPA